jgi:transglutaminase-like putative cysteine protease
MIDSIGAVGADPEFCRRDKFWEIRDPLITKTADQLRRDSRDTQSLLSNTFTWVRDNLKLREPQPTRLGAARAIRDLSGDCDEFSDLFIALCRANGIPCRRVVGLFFHGRDDRGKSFEWHAWAEVLVSNNAWIPFDPSLNFFTCISDRHLPRCCMGRRSEYPIRRLTWRSPPTKPPVLNDDDVESVAVVPA